MFVDKKLFSSTLMPVKRKQAQSLVNNTSIDNDAVSTFEEIEETFKDLKNVGCDILTVGQYIQPSKKHLEVDKYYTLEEFEQIKNLAKKVGFKHFQIGPLVRSSYMAKDLV